ncbi:MAG TPA: CvpA family protein [Candidatus Saccharimonadales bacterium]|nr:CvpA family protein [Candidatus Saccharimonadales bacterium]
MNWIDALIIVTFAVYFFEGIRRGFIEQTLELLGFFITIFLATWTYQPIGNFLLSHTGVNQNTADPLAFLIDWVFLQALYSLALKLLYPLIPFPIRSNVENRLAGLIPAFLKGLIIVSVIITITALLPVPEVLKNQIDNSLIGSRIVAQSGRVESVMDKILGRDVKQSLTFLTVPSQTEQIIEPGETVDLKFKTSDISVDTASEQKMLSLVNQERAKVGLNSLVWDEQLAKVGRAHSADMLENGYFSHTGLDGSSPFDRMSKAGIAFSVAGENLAYAATVDLAHNGLMNSPGHRANILDKDYGHIGIGVIDGGIYGKMFSQEFTN